MIIVKKEVDEDGVEVDKEKRSEGAASIFI